MATLVPQLCVPLAIVGKDDHLPSAELLLQEPDDHASVVPVEADDHIIERLTEFANKGSHGSSISVNNAWNDIRPLLEEYLRFRFPEFWIETGKKKWLKDFVDLAKSNTGPHVLPLTPEQISKIEHFKDNTNEPHHGGGTQAKATPTETELMTLVGEVLHLVKKS